MYLSIYGSVTIAEQLDTLPQGGSRWLKIKKSDLKPLKIFKCLSLISASTTAMCSTKHAEVSL